MANGRAALAADLGVMPAESGAKGVTMSVKAGLLRYILGGVVVFALGAGTASAYILMAYGKPFMELDMRNRRDASRRLAFALYQCADYPTAKRGLLEYTTILDLTQGDMEGDATPFLKAVAFGRVALLAEKAHVDVERDRYWQAALAALAQYPKEHTTDSQLRSSIADLDKTEADTLLWAVPKD
jgi:hypothetical protein